MASRWATPRRDRARSKDAGTSHLPVRHVFMFQSVRSRNTAWLNGCLALDEKGYVLTGRRSENDKSAPVHLRSKRACTRIRHWRCPVRLNEASGFGRRRGCGCGRADSFCPRCFGHGGVKGWSTQREEPVPRDRKPCLHSRTV